MIFDGTSFMILTGKTGDPELDQARVVFTKERDKELHRLLHEQRTRREDKGQYPSLKALCREIGTLPNMDLKAVTIETIVRAKGWQKDLQPSQPIDYNYIHQPFIPETINYHTCAW